MKKVLLVVLPYVQSNKVDPDVKMKSFVVHPYGMLSIATYCRDVADIHFLDCNVEGNYRQKFMEEAGKWEPDIIGFGMQFDNSYEHLKELASLVHMIDIDMKATVVVGGAATLPVYKTILQENNRVDAVCFGDGERPVLSLVTTGSFYSNAWVTRSTLFQGVAPSMDVVPNVDEIIDINYSYIDVSRYALRSEFSPLAEDLEDPKRFYVHTSFGCPFKCSFCYRSRTEDRKMRFASVDRVIERVKYLVGNYGMTCLTLCDDQLLIDMKRSKELFKRLIPFKLRVESYQGLSVGFIDNELAGLMKAAGMVRAVLPIESGCQYVLDNMVDKPVDLDHAKDVIRMLRKHGFWVTALFVCGFPGETDEHRKETMKWIDEADLDWSTFSAAIPIRGTRLYDMCVEGGYINEVPLGKLDYGKYIIKTPGYEPDYVSRQIYLMNLKCNFVNNRAMAIGDYETAARTFQWVIGIYEGHAFAHYYLGKCLYKLGREKEGWKHLVRGIGIIEKERDTWLSYVNELALDWRKDER